MTPTFDNKSITMNILDIYKKCGLKDPELFEKEVKVNALFTGVEEIRSVVGRGRRLGKTTGLMMQSIQNLYSGHSSVIWVPSFLTARLQRDNLYRHLEMFPELGIDVRNDREFCATMVRDSPRIYIIPKYNNQIQNSGFIRYDFEYYDFDQLY